jgi:Alpha/beta hydrolase family
MTPSGNTPATSGANASSANLTPQPGTLESGIKVDVGGYALFVRCTGHGSPTAVFDAGANNGSSAWSAVAPKVAAFTTTCVYDRANLGKSDRGPIPNTSQQIVHDLHTLLGKVRVVGPFVLVGHSFGGMNMGLYARLYPEEAAGLVMVDAANEAAYVGPTRVCAQVCNGVDYLESGRQVQAAPPMRAIPLIVIEHGIAGGLPPAAEQQWHGWQQDLASRSPHSKLIVAERSSHEIESDQPDLVVAAVQEIVEQVRYASGAVITNRPAGRTSDRGPELLQKQRRSSAVD